MVVFVAFVACIGNETGDDSTPEPPITTPEPPPTDTGTSLPTDTGTPVDPCGPDPAVDVVSAVATPGRLKNQMVVTVGTSDPTDVAIRCTAASDPTDVHLLESPSGTSHTFDLGGLLVEEHYDCLAAAVCPQGTSAPEAFSFDTLEAPGTVVPAAVDIDPVLGMTGAYTMFNVEPSSGSWDWLHIVDPAGRTRWWHPIPNEPNMGLEARHHGGGLIVWGGGYTSLGRVRQVDVFLGEVYDSATSLPDYASTIFHHDGKQIADGRILTLEAVTDTIDVTSFEGFAVRLHDPATGELSWRYASEQALEAKELDPDDYWYGDPWHANWVDVIVENGADKLYMSLCGSYEIIKVDPVLGTIEWTFGAGEDFALVDTNGNPLSDSEFPSCQHGIEIIGDHLLVYDNGWERGESRIAEYDLDAVSMTATLLWTWTDGWYTCCLGDADQLPNGRVLVNQASFGYGWPTEIHEIDPLTGAVASTVTLRVSDASYRAERLDGCELFANAAYCTTVADRVAELAPIFDP
jgi:hypothetical protein